MRRLGAALAVAAIVGAGCTTAVDAGRGSMVGAGGRAGAGSGAPPAYPSPTSTSAAGSPRTQTYPNARPGEHPPRRPVDVFTVAGSEAFARYYVAALDWAIASSDTTLLRAAFDPRTCSSCTVFADAVDEMRTLRMEIRGGRQSLADPGVLRNDRLLQVVFRDGRWIIHDVLDVA